METVEFKVDERYSKAASWFRENLNIILIPEEVEDIFIEVEYGNKDTLLEFFESEHDSFLHLDQIDQIQNLINSLKDNQ